MASTIDNIKLTGVTEEFIDPQGDRSVLLRTIALIDNNGLPISATNPLYVTGASGSSSTSAVTVADGADQTLGAKADSSATTDSGSFSVVALVKRSLANWTTLLARIPALVSGRLPVDGSGVTQPISGTVAVSGTVPVSGTFFQATQPVSVSAGEAHIGEIGGNVGKFQTQFGPASSTTYTTGQCMSAAIQVTGMGRVANGTGLITSATLEMLVANSVEVDLIFFSAAPSGTYTAGSAFTIAAADRVKVSKVIKIIDWTLLGAADSVGEPTPAPKFYKCDDTTNTTSLWVIPVARGSITLASATDATLTIRAARN